MVRPIAAVIARVIASGPGWYGEQLGDARVHRRVELGRRNEALHEPGPQQLGTCDRSACHDPVASQCQTHLPDEQRYAGPGKRDAHREFGDANDGGVGCDANVTGSGEQRSAANDMALETGHRCLRDAVELLEKALPGGRAVATRHPVTFHLRVGGGSKVRAGRERSTFAGDDDDPKVDALLKLVQRGDECAPDVVVQRIERVGARQRQPSDGRLEEDLKS